MNKNDIFYVCSLIESIARSTGLNKGQIIDTIGQQGIKHLYKYANVNHCLPIQQVTDEVMEQYHFNEKVNHHDYKNSIWDVGKIYQRLIVDISDENTWINNLFDVYHSFITVYIDDERKPIYWQSRSYIKECYLQGEIL